MAKQGENGIAPKWSRPEHMTQGDESKAGLCEPRPECEAWPGTSVLTQAHPGLWGLCGS